MLEELPHPKARRFWSKYLKLGVRCLFCRWQAVIICSSPLPGMKARLTGAKKKTVLCRTDQLTATCVLKVPLPLAVLSLVLPWQYKPKSRCVCICSKLMRTGLFYQTTRGGCLLVRALEGPSPDLLPVWRLSPAIQRPIHLSSTQAICPY